jgi:hypothetical protein
MTAPPTHPPNVRFSLGLTIQRPSIAVAQSHGIGRRVRQPRHVDNSLRGVDRADERTVGARSAPGVVARWRCVSRSREWSVSVPQRLKSFSNWRRITDHRAADSFASFRVRFSIVCGRSITHRSAPAVPASVGDSLSAGPARPWTARRASTGHGGCARGPSGVRGPALAPPCIRHRSLGIAGT